MSFFLLSLLTVFSIIFFAFWRRWFGGGYVNTFLKNNRAVECATFIVICTMVLLSALVILNSLYPLPKWALGLISFLISVAIYCQFWARGHGACFDLGRDKNPSSDTIRRYNERWYHFPCDKLLKEHKYGFLYDFIYMGLRYTMPMVLIYAAGLIPMAFGLKAIFNSHLILIGLAISPIYSFCWILSELEPWLFKKFKYICGATNLAEYLAGAIFGLIVLTLN